MGGFGSGRWRAEKNLTVDYPQMDVRYLQQQGYLEPGLSLHLKPACHDKSMESVTIKTEPGKLIIGHHYRKNESVSEDIYYHFKIEWTACHFGGKRPWFICPVADCGRRVAILYGGAQFTCRNCNRLAYPCQRENPANRRLRKVNKIRRQLGWEPGILNAEGGKPKNMHWKTFLRLMNTYDALYIQDVLHMAQKF